MKFGIIVGSHRKEAQSLKVARYFERSIRKSNSDYAADVITLTENPLPLWDESIWSGLERWKKDWGPYGERLTAADALIVIAPEWGGMVPAGLKNFFLFTNAAHVGHKPALIVAVSAGMGGSYPVNELRISSYKNNRLCYLPEHIIVRHVGDVLNDFEQAAGESDIYIRGRIDYSIQLLAEYALALRQVRAAGVVDHKTYPNGM